MRKFAILLLAIFALLPSLAAAPSENGYQSLAASLRPLILNALPKPLYEKSENWGNQAPALERIRWRRWRPQIVKAMRNDGTWRKTRVTAPDAPGTLEFRLSDLKAVGADRHSFKAFVSLKIHVDHEEEIWEKGVRLLRTTAEARLRVKANLEIETTMRFEADPKAVLPDAVFRMRVTKADVGYDNLVVENIGGVGGTAARWLGEAIRSGVKKWKPSIERELLAKANAAIVKNADTREVRLSFANLVSKLAAARK